MTEKSLDLSEAQSELTCEKDQFIPKSELDWGSPLRYEAEDETVKTYDALTKYTFTEKEVEEKILGAQCIYVTKLLNLKEALATKEGLAAAQEEFLKMVQNGVFGRTPWKRTRSGTRT